MRIWPFWIEIEEQGDDKLLLIEYRWWHPAFAATVIMQGTRPDFYWVSSTGDTKFINYHDKPYEAALSKWFKKKEAQRVENNLRREKELRKEFLKGVFKPVEKPKEPEVPEARVVER